MRRRLVLVMGASTLLVALAFVVPLGWLVQRFAHERAVDRARQVATALTPALLTGEDGGVEIAIAALDTPGITVAMPDGTVLGEGPTLDAADLERARAGAAFLVERGGGVLVVRPVIRPTAGTVVVAVEVTAEQRRQGVAASWAILAAIGVVIVIGSVLIADRLARDITRPAGDVAASARALAAGDLSARAPLTGPAEVSDIAVALNGLAARIEELLAAEREAAADLSHRLRTPIQAVRLEAERLPSSPDRARMLETVSALEDAVTDVITQVREPRRDSAEVDAATAVRNRMAFWSVLAAEQERPLDVDIEDGAALRLPADDLDAIVDALVGNALAHTPAGTPVTVALRRGAAGMTLTVDDGGPGLDSGALDRGASGAGSSGLGLDIARAAAGRAGGELRVGTSPLGGARVAVELPDRQ